MCIPTIPLIRQNESGYAMRSLSVGLTESQLDHLRTIKQKYGISMGGFIRTLLKVDMERPLIPEYAVVEERSEITTTKTRRRVAIRRGPISPERAALMKELNVILTRRREKIDRTKAAIVASPLRA